MTRPIHPASPAFQATAADLARWIKAGSEDPAGAVEVLWHALHAGPTATCPFHEPAARRWHRMRAALQCRPLASTAPAKAETPADHSPARMADEAGHQPDLPSTDATAIAGEGSEVSLDTIRRTNHYHGLDD